jgi:hypothetical protein
MKVKRPRYSRQYTRQAEKSSCGSESGLANVVREAFSKPVVLEQKNDSSTAANMADAVTKLMHLESKLSTLIELSEEGEEMDSYEARIRAVRSEINKQLALLE